MNDNDMNNRWDSEPQRDATYAAGERLDRENGELRDQLQALRKENGALRSALLPFAIAWESAPVNYSTNAPLEIGNGADGDLLESGDAHKWLRLIHLEAAAQAFEGTSEKVK